MEGGKTRLFASYHFKTKHLCIYLFNRFTPTAYFSELDIAAHIFVLLTFEALCNPHINDVDEGLSSLPDT